jgi:hypothetical protein
MPPEASTPCVSQEDASARLCPLPVMIWQCGIRRGYFCCTSPAYYDSMRPYTSGAFWPGLGGNIHMAFDNLALVLGWADLLFYFSQPVLDAVHLLN